MHSLNGFQTISIIGLVFSVFCQGVLILVGKTVTDMWALYPTWAGIFLLGTVLRFLIKDEDHHH